MDTLQIIKKNFVLCNGIYDICLSVWWPMNHDMVRYNPPWMRTYLLCCGILRLCLAQRRAIKWTYAVNAVICLRTKKTRELGILYYLLSTIL